MTKRRGTLRDGSPPVRCITGGKLTSRPDGFCSSRCKDAAQVRVWGVPVRDLPVKRRLPRLVPGGGS